MENPHRRYTPPKDASTQELALIARASERLAQQKLALIRAEISQYKRSLSLIKSQPHSIALDPRISRYESMIKRLEAQLPDSDTPRPAK